MDADAPCWQGAPKAHACEVVRLTTLLRCVGVRSCREAGGCGNCAFIVGGGAGDGGGDSASLEPLEKGMLGGSPSPSSDSPVRRCSGYISCTQGHIK